jgi:Zn finger protein HypA/HybF involved in hydrogenase expression
MNVDPAKHIPRLQEIGHIHGFVLESQEAARPRGKIRYRCPRGHEVRVVRDTALYSEWKGHCESCIFEDRLEKLQEIVASHGGRLLTRRRKLLTTDKIKIECAAGHRWDKRVYSLLEGTWCPKCHIENRQITLQDANRLVSPFGGRCVSESLQGSQVPLVWECELGHQWTRSYQEQKKQLVFCPKCRIPTGRENAKKVSLEEKRRRSFKRIQKTAKDRGGRCLSKIYTNQLAPMKWQCAEGHRWTAPAQPILHYGAWCRVCSQQARKNAITIETLREFAAKRGGTVLSDQYHRNNIKILWKCSEGHEFARTWMSMRKTKSFCPRCGE